MHIQSGPKMSYRVFSQLHQVLMTDFRYSFSHTLGSKVIIKDATTP